MTGLVDVEILGGPHDGDILRATAGAPTVTCLTSARQPCGRPGCTHPGRVVVILAVEHRPDGKHVAHWPRNTPPQEQHT